MTTANFSSRSNVTEDYFEGIATDPWCRALTLLGLVPSYLLGSFFVICIAWYEKHGKDQERTVFSFFAEQLAQLVLLCINLCLAPLIVRFGFGIRLRYAHI